MQRSDCLQAAPAHAGKLATPLFDCQNRALGLPGLKLIQGCTYRGKVVVCLPKQSYNPQAAQLLLVIETVCAAAFTDGVQQTLLLPEAQRRNTYSSQARRCTDTQALRDV